MYSQITLLSLLYSSNVRERRHATKLIPLSFQISSEHFLLLVPTPLFPRLVPHLTQLHAERRPQIQDTLKAVTLVCNSVNRRITAQKVPYKSVCTWNLKLHKYKVTNQHSAYLDDLVAEMKHLPNEFPLVRLNKPRI